MLRLVLLVLYLVTANSGSILTKIGGGLDPNGSHPPTPPVIPSENRGNASSGMIHTKIGGGLDPDGLHSQTPPATPSENGDNGWRSPIGGR